MMDDIIQNFRHKKDSIDSINAIPCSVLNYTTTSYQISDWNIHMLPKVTESERCGISNIINKAIEPYGGLEQMDIQYSNYPDCIPEIFMISTIKNKKNVVWSSGHLSCFYVLIVAGDYQIYQHVDVTSIMQSQELDNLYKQALKQRLQALRDSSKVNTLSIFLGASNIDSISAFQDIYQQESKYLLKCIKKCSLFKQYTVKYITGPNTISLNIEHLFQLGSIDDILTTDIITIPAEKTFYIVRPINPIVFDTPFTDVKEQIIYYRDYFKKNGNSLYKERLSDIENHK